MQRRTRVVLSAVAVATLALPAPAAAQTKPKTKTFIAKRPAEALLDVRALAPGADWGRACMTASRARRGGGAHARPPGGGDLAVSPGTLRAR